MDDTSASRCPAVELLSKLLDETLDDQHYDAISSHVESCKSCQDLLETLSDDVLMDETQSSSFDSSVTNRPSPEISRVIEQLINQTNPDELSGKNLPQPQLQSPGADIRFPDRPTLSGSCGAIGKYEVLRRIAAGANGVLYEAWDRELDRSVALKILKDFAQPDSDAYRRLVREAKAASEIHHEHVLPVYEFIARSDFPPMLVMKLMSGRTLADLIREPAPIAPRQAADLVRQAARGIAAAHEAGLVHRDIKPSNLLLLEEGDSIRVLVSDFGLVRDESAESELTQTGDLAGTPAYMSPEQIEDAKAIDARTDVYSLGCVLYQLLTGQLPFSGTVRMILWQILHDDVRPPSKLDDRVPMAIENICMKAMSRTRLHRYQDGSALAEDLDRFLSGEPTIARKPGRMSMIAGFIRRHPVAVVSSLLGLISLFSIATISTLSAFRLAAAEDETRIQANRAARDRDIAIEAMEAMVFDVYDQLEQPVYDTDSVQINLLNAAARGLSQIEAGYDSDLLRSQAASHSRLGRAMWRKGRYPQATEQLKIALGHISQMRDQERAEVDVQRLHLSTVGALARTYFSLEDEEQMWPLLKQARDGADSLLGRDPDEPRTIAESAEIYQDYAYAIADDQDDQQSIQWHEKALETHRRLGGIDDLSFMQRMDRLLYYEDLARTLDAIGKTQLAIEAYSDMIANAKQALVIDQQSEDAELLHDTKGYLITACTEQAYLLSDQGNAGQAIDNLMGVKDLAQAYFNQRPRDPFVQEMMENLIDAALEISRDGDRNDHVIRWAETSLAFERQRAELGQQDRRQAKRVRRAEKRLEQLRAEVSE